MLINVAKEVKDFYDEENFKKLMNRLLVGRHPKFMYW